MSFIKNLFLLLVLSFISLDLVLLETQDITKSINIKNKEDFQIKTDESEIVFNEDEIIDIYSKPDEVSSEWKSSMAEQFYKDIAVIKQVVLDGEKDREVREKFLKSFRDQQDWFDEAVSSVQNVGDISYEEIKEKKFFISRIANAQRRSDLLLLNFSKNLKLSSFVKKKVRLDILADINTYVLEEMKRGLKSSKAFYLSDRAVKNIVNENLKEFTRKDLVSRGIDPTILNSINSNIGRLITKEDYQTFSTKLRKNISGKLKEVFFTIEKRLEKQIEEQSKKNKEETSKNYQAFLGTLDVRLSSTEARLQIYIDRKMDEFTSKLDMFTENESKKKGLIDLDIIENNMKSYFDAKLKGIEDKINETKNSIDVTRDIVSDTKESINTVNNDSRVDGKQMKSIFNISKRNIDKKIYDEVGKQLSALKEDRLRKFEKLSRNKKKYERRKLLRDLLEKELSKNFG